MAQEAVTHLIWQESGTRYALPASAVERAVAMSAITPLPQTGQGVLGVIDIAGKIVPVISLAGALHGSPLRRQTLKDILIIAISNQGKIVLVADRLEGVVAFDPGRVVRCDETAIVAQGIAGIIKDPQGLVLIPDLEWLHPSSPNPPVPAGLLAAA